jgi:hypothetical protein
MELFWITLSV